MNLCLKVKSFYISAGSEKEAYLKGCKQLAKYLASKKYKNLSFKIERTKEENGFIFTIFSNLDLGKEQRDFCKVCREFHCNFYVNEEYNCNRCNLKSFLVRAEQKARVSKNFYNKRIE